jgi:hypothetical protein
LAKRRRVVEGRFDLIFTSHQILVQEITTKDIDSWINVRGPRQWEKNDEFLTLKNQVQEKKQKPTKE